MFTSQNVACYLAAMGHKKVKIGKDKFNGTVMTLHIDPFTPELASELGDTKGVIFRRQDSDLNPHVEACSFTYAPKPQVIEFRPDPTIAKPSVTIQEAKVTKFRVRRAADGTQWVLVFKITFAEVGGNDLLYLKEALFEQRFISFADLQGGLFEDAEQEERRSAKEAKPVRGSSGATAH